MKEIKIWHALFFLFVVIFGCIAFVILDKHFEGQYRFLFLIFVGVCVIGSYFLWAYSAALRSREWIRKSERKPLSKDPVWYVLWMICFLLTAVWLIWMLEAGLQDPLVQEFGFHAVLLKPAYVFWIVIPLYWHRYKKREKYDEERRE